MHLFVAGGLLEFVHVLLFCLSRLRNRGADDIGRYDTYVKTVLVILVAGFANRFLPVGCFPCPRYCLVFDGRFKMKL